MNECSRPWATASIVRASSAAAIGRGSPRATALRSSVAASLSTSARTAAYLARSRAAHQEQVELLGEQQLGARRRAQEAPYGGAEGFELLAQRAVGLEGAGDVERVGQLLDHRPPQFGLAGEVGVDRPLGEPGVPGDRLQRAPLDAAFGELGDCGLDDRCRRQLLLLLPGEPLVLACHPCHDGIAYTIRIATAI